ncbi:MAG: ATP-dependent DNA helicase RecG [Bdellovibrionales bacterium]|nr:ATP-dependent DNA helicase RecG [Bdellovibrionales bacterium]
MSLTIDTSVQYIKGVGPKLGGILSRRGINTVGDLLEWFPRSYEDHRAIRNIASLQVEQVVSLVAEVVSLRSSVLGRSGKRMFEMVVKDQTGRVSCKFFRIPHKGFFDKFQTYDKIQIIGKVSNYRGRTEFLHPEIHHAQIGIEESDSLVPIYTETEGLSPSKIRRVISTALDSSSLEDPLPTWMCRDFELLERSQALREIHQPPKNAADLFLTFRSPAQQRMIFDDFFWMELLLVMRRAELEGEKAYQVKPQSSRVDNIRDGLAFQLTFAQNRAFGEIVTDLQKQHPMHRLVQGDVGCGKTIVALLAAAQVADSGFQTCLMVPTEILATQHFQSWQKRLEPLGLRVALLTSQAKESTKKEIYQRLVSGEIDIVIGTQALLQSKVQFKQLGLVIVDEQHRFGVEQRVTLKEKGISPHFLLMTATPIPRSLAMTLYGDLDVSVIDELPLGRQPILTRVTHEAKRALIWEFLEKQVNQGRQAYVVYPLVDESEKIDLKNAREEFEKLKARFPQFSLGLLHGKMKSVEKDQTMKEFREGKIQILVATTVIEVGVDVPNSNIMVIEHAERFGLSQLHQLRGRVGRGEYKSYCILVLGSAVSDEARQRVEIMERSGDGFKIAEADLELRGPGEFLGTRQSGLLGFKMADLVRDFGTLEKARAAAINLIEVDPNLEKPEHQKIQRQLKLKQTNLWG